jgi:amino acid transporter
MIIFLAYEGFELIANTAEDVQQPARTLPRAYYSAVIFVILLYILIAGITVGSLPTQQIVAAKEYALAAAAKPFLGTVAYLAAVVVLLAQTAQTNPENLWIVFVIGGLGFMIELVYRQFTNRQIHLNSIIQTKMK